MRIKWARLVTSASKVSSELFSSDPLWDATFLVKSLTVVLNSPVVAYPQQAFDSRSDVALVCHLYDFACRIDVIVDTTLVAQRPNWTV